MNGLKEQLKQTFTVLPESPANIDVVKRYGKVVFLTRMSNPRPQVCKVLMIQQVELKITKIRVSRFTGSCEWRKK